MQWGLPARAPSDGELVDQASDPHEGKQVGELMKEYNQLYAEGKYKEAEVAALKARDLDPDNVAAGAGIKLAQTAAAHANY